MLLYYLRRIENPSPGPMNVTAVILRPALIVPGILAISGFATADAAAQSVAGQVVDESTDAAVAFAEVALIDSAGAVVRNVVADSSGSFFIRADPGRFRVQASRIGFATMLSEYIELRPDEPVIVELRMSAEGIPLEPLIVRARGIERGRDAWERRRRMGSGIFLDADSIALRSPRFVTDAFRGVRGIMVRRQGGIRSMSGYRCMAIFVNHTVDPFEAETAAGLGGRPRLALGGAGIDVHAAEDMRAIEIYPTWWDIPEELRTVRLAEIWPCGIAIVWTKAAW